VSFRLRSFTRGCDVHSLVAAAFLCTQMMEQALKKYMPKVKA
jgi:hypothetical protein